MTLRERAALSDSGGLLDQAIGPAVRIRIEEVQPSAAEMASAPATVAISELHHAAHPLAVYASQPPSRADHARLASSPVAFPLAGRDSHPRVTT